MADIKLGLVEARFADIVWANAPMTTKELVSLCEQALNWKRTTTYTVLKKLCDRGLFEMKDHLITVLLPKAEFHAIQSEQFVNENFKGSLPAFIAAFAARKTLSQEELSQIRTLIESFKDE